MSFITLWRTPKETWLLLGPTQTLFTCPFFQLQIRHTNSVEAHEAVTSQGEWLFLHRQWPSQSGTFIYSLTHSFTHSYWLCSCIKSQNLGWRRTVRYLYGMWIGLLRYLEVKVNHSQNPVFTKYLQSVCHCKCLLSACIEKFSHHVSFLLFNVQLPFCCTLFQTEEVTVWWRRWRRIPQHSSTHNFIMLNKLPFFAIVVMS